MEAVNNDGWFGFDALIEPMTWGRSTYTILRLDPGLTKAAVEAAPDGSRERSRTPTSTSASIVPR
jgi:hypothetical protein